MTSINGSAPQAFFDGDLYLYGANHRTASIELRERLAFTDGTLPSAYHRVRAFAAEAYILSTCNRTEIYAVGSVADPTGHLARFLAETAGVSVLEVEEHAYSHSGEEAVRSLLRVACGLESMVLGEAQILGQVKDAYETALGAGSIGRVLGRVVPLAVEVGKRARAETRIGRGALSPSSAAVELARRAVGDLCSSSILVLGAGDAAQATVRSLAEAGVAKVVVVNRSLRRAAEVASAVGGRPAPYADLVPCLAGADIVICSTGATEHVITVLHVRRAMAERPDRSLVCIDIAVPRDVDPAVAHVPGVHLYNVDDLESVCSANLRGRRREVAPVEAIIQEGIKDYQAWNRAQRVIPTVGALYQQAEQIRRTEVDRTVRRMGGLSSENRALIDAMTSSIVRRILHGPVTALKARSDRSEEGDLARLVEELFGLDGDVIERPQAESAQADVPRGASA